MTREEEILPEGVQPLDDGDQFFVELCDLIDDHAENRDMSRRELLYHMEVFKEDWMDTYSATGAFWRSPKEGIKDDHIYSDE